MRQLLNYIKELLNDPDFKTLNKTEILIKINKGELKCTT